MDKNEIEAILKKANNQLESLKGQSLDLIEVSKAKTVDYGAELAKVISKLSPLLGNMIEYSTIDALNKVGWHYHGRWIRQDPGFPDAQFCSDRGGVEPGVEIKAWFPFSTEMTARFRDSQTIFADDHIEVAIMVWVPEFILWGKPKIIDALIVKAGTVAKARDDHYFDPPNYLVIEPEDTSDRTANLQQTNTAGYVFQGTPEEFKEAKIEARRLGLAKYGYSTDADYQKRINELRSKYKYRLDTNYAKIDRIDHPEIEAFKVKINNTVYLGKTIKQWTKSLFEKEADLSALADLLDNYVED